MVRKAPVEPRGLPGQIGSRRQHDQYTQQAQIQEENEVIQEAVDPGQREGVVGDAGEEKESRHKRLGESGSEFGGQHRRNRSGLGKRRQGGIGDGQAQQLLQPAGHGFLRQGRAIQPDFDLKAAVGSDHADNR